MLIHPWDAAISETEWRHWLAAGHDFGQIAVNDPDKNGARTSSPPTSPWTAAPSSSTWFRPNKIWAAVPARPIVVMSVVNNYTYVPTTWRAKAGGPDEDGVPTSYYSAVQLTCHAEIVDDPQRKAELLRRQLAHFQPRGDHAQVGVDLPPYGRMLSGIRGLRLHIASVAAKFRLRQPQPARAPRQGRRTPGKPGIRPGTAPQPRSNAGASRKSANGNPATDPATRRLIGQQHTDHTGPMIPPPAATQGASAHAADGRERRCTLLESALGQGHQNASIHWIWCGDH